MDPHRNDKFKHTEPKFHHTKDKFGNQLEIGDVSTTFTMTMCADMAKSGWELLRTSLHGKLALMASQ